MVQKAMCRLAEEMAPVAVSQLVMWHLVAGLDWNSIAQMSQKWANRYELTLAKTSWHTWIPNPRLKAAGFFLMSREQTKRAKRWQASSKMIQSKLVLGLLAETGIPPRPNSPAVACRVRLKRPTP